MKLPVISLIAGLLLHAVNAHAAVRNVRVVWDTAPSSQAVIGFSRNGSSSPNPHVRFGLSPDENTWTASPTAVTRTFKSTLVNHFVRLSGLQANRDYYFKACDDSGCIGPYLFRTAPDTTQPLTFVAGGDSRTNIEGRRQGNRLVAKIRPHFVLFSGDYTDSHTVAEMNVWLQDWNQSFSTTVINGVTYQQVPPLVPTVGNHEASDMNFVCSVFGVDADTNGSCTLRDTYFALNISPLLRVYTLNTEFGSSYANDRAAQLAWLTADLAASSTATTWRMAQYHKPMFPRSSSKPSVNAIAFAWAQPFYDYRVNLVNESDTHVLKYTYPVKPVGSAYAKVDAGTVYIGEGAWGAPPRTDDRNASWTIDHDSFSHLNVIQATPTGMDIRTVYFDSEPGATTLTKAGRDANPLALPTGWTLWDANGVGTVFSLKQNTDRHTYLDEALSDAGIRVSLPATQDVTVGNKGYCNNASPLWADGDSAGEKLRAMIGWNTAVIPTTARVIKATLKTKVTDPTNDAYQFSLLSAPWTEAACSYTASTQTEGVLGAMTPTVIGTSEIHLNSTGLAAVEGWVRGTRANNGVALSSAGTWNGLAVAARESGTGPELIVTYTTQQASLAASRDVTVGSAGYFKDTTYLWSDTDNGGQAMRSLIGWNLAGIPAGTRLGRATLSFYVSNSSPGSFSLHALTAAWSESDADYSRALATSVVMGQFTPAKTGQTTVELSSDGLAMVQGWLDGTVPNQGLVLVSDGSTDGVTITSREGGKSALLILDY